MTTPLQLIDLADSVLDRTVPVPGGRAARSASVIARQALEQLVEDQCASLLPDNARPSMRSRLIVLRELGPGGVGATAESAWSQLSDACHHSAYELAPSAAHVRELVSLVRSLAKP